MKMIEENLLKNTILQLNKYREKHFFVNDFYESLNELKIDSLQSFSFQKDIEFFDRLSFILGVINSIIAHPHISNRGENIILRSDQAGHLTSENFQNTFRDPSLWKEKELEMVPEYVHYYQYTDELKIYENLFIRLLIDLIDLRLIEYLVFYTSMVPSLDNPSSLEIISNDKVEIALNRIENFSRKVRFIKNTFFYKELSKVPPISKQIKPTNILLKDRLYNYCYRFYREFIKYEDNNELQFDFTLYYYYVMLKSFNKRGFKLINKVRKNNDIKKNQPLDISNFAFSYRDFIINVSYEAPSTIWMEIGIKNRPETNYRHQLILQAKRTIDDDIVASNLATTCYIISIWNIYNQLDYKASFINPTSESDIIDFWIDRLLYEVIAEKNMYVKYCPICKNRSIDESNNIYKCTNCQTIYTFKSSKGKDIIWFINLRR